MVKIRQDEIQVEPVEATKFLFTTSTCPNCKMAKEILREEKVDVKVIDAQEIQIWLENMGFARRPHWW